MRVPLVRISQGNENIPVPHPAKVPSISAGCQFDNRLCKAFVNQFRMHHPHQSNPHAFVEKTVMLINLSVGIIQCVRKNRHARTRPVDKVVTFHHSRCAHGRIAKEDFRVTYVSLQPLIPKEQTRIANTGLMMILIQRQRLLARLGPLNSIRRTI